MKKLILGLIWTFTFTVSFGQSSFKLEYCNCIDKIDQITPLLDGKYERVCDGKTIETGVF